MYNKAGNSKHKHSKPRKKRVKKETNKLGFFGNIKKKFMEMPKKKRVVVLSLISVILVLVILIGIVLGVVLSLLRDYNHNELKDPDILQIQPIDDQIMNIALFGIDSRSQSFSGLSDSIMILSINTGTGDIKLISVMRDSFVKMPEYKGKSYKPNKINSAYSRGGPEYAIKTLNQNFGLDIKEYATVNFFGMAEIIDAAGGIEIEVLQREINAKYGLNDNVREQAKKLGVKPQLVEKPGLQTLTGMQAVAWARIRSVSTQSGTANDYGRTDRQRIVMEKLLNKALSTNISKYPALIKAILPHMQTSISFNEAVSLATNVLGSKVQFEQTRVPQAKYVINDNFYVSYAGSVVYYDLEFASKAIHAMIYDGMTQEDYIKQNGVEKNSWYDGYSSSSSNKKPSSSSSNSNTNNSSNNSTSSVVSDDSPSDEDTPSENLPSDDGSQEDSSQDTTPSTPEHDSGSSDNTNSDSTNDELLNSDAA